MLRQLRIAIVALALLAPSAAAAATGVGKPAPAFTVVTLDGQKYSLADLKGKVVVLNYWATWCAPCRNELAMMEAYVRAHPGTDLKIFAIDTSDPNLPTQQFKPLQGHLSFPLVFRISSWGYGSINDSIPTSYVIDRRGVVRYADAGAFNVNSFDATVTPLLDEAAPPSPVDPVAAMANVVVSSK